MPNPQPSNDAVLELLSVAFQKDIVSGKKVFQQAVEEALRGREQDVEWIKANFSKLVETVQLRAYEIYLDSERRVGSLVLRTVFGALAGETPTGEQVLSLLSEYFPALDRFFLALTQGRRPRAGAAFEQLIKGLFTKLGYPFTARPLVDGRPDFLLPSLDHYKTHPLDCVIFTIKRTLRERWRQIVTEGTKALGFYLATIDRAVSEGDLRAMTAGKIYLVVPTRLKDSIENYRRAGNVISFESFFKHHLDPAMERWREAGAIT